jgi:hypothetical protein
VTYDIEKFARLQVLADTIADTARAASERYRQARALLRDLEVEADTQRRAFPAYRTVRNMENGGVEQKLYMGGGAITPDMQQALDAASADVATLRSYSEEISQQHAQARGLLTRLTAHLRQHGVDVDHLPAVRPLRRVAGAVAPASDAVDTVRAEIATTKREQKRLLRALPSRADAEAAIDAWMASRERVEPTVQLNSQRVFIRLLDDGPANARVENVVIDGAAEERTRVIEGWLVSLAPERVRERLLAVATRGAEQAGGWGPSQEERARTLAEFDKRLFALERREEELIEQFEDAGIMITRRQDADPRAVLLQPATSAA